MTNWSFTILQVNPLSLGVSNLASLCQEFLMPLFESTCRAKLVGNNAPKKAIFSTLPPRAGLTHTWSSI